MIVDQQLHGYNHGHELLSGSITLPPRDQDLVDRLSDIAGPIAPGEKIPPYITCYPLPSGSHYVVARTWHDREAPRAGCVRTRSLLIPMAEWTSVADPSTLVALATDAGPTQKMKRLSVEPGPAKPSPPVETAGAELLEALFLEHSVSVAVFGSKSAELIALRILTAIWPSMRRRFTVSTFCNSPRTISKKSFDLVFAPVEARSRFSDWKGRRVDGIRAGPLRHRWSSRIADEVFRAPYPSLSALDTFGEMAEDEKGSEEALRLSLLWGELADKVGSEPHAALGLLDIANTRMSRRSELITELAPVLARAATTAVSAMAPSEAWRFLQVLIGKLGETRWRLSLIRSVRSSTVALAQRHPIEAVEAIPHLLKDGGEFLLSGIAAGIAKADAFERVASSLTGLSGDALLRTVLAAPELTVRLLEDDYGVEPSLVASIGGANGDEIAEARKRILPQLVDDRHAGVLGALLANAGASTIVIEAERLRNANDLTAVALNSVLVDAAQREGGATALRDVAAKARQSQASNAMLRQLLGSSVADVRWILDTMEKADARRPMLLADVLTSASNEQLRSIFGQPGMLSDVLVLAGDLPSATEVLARIVENVRLQPADHIGLVMRILPRIDGPRAGSIAVSGLEAALPKDLGAERESIVSTLLDRAGAQLDGVRVLKVGAGQGVPAGLASSNLTLFDRSPPSVRAKLLENPIALADTVVSRKTLDLSYQGGEAVGRLLWDSDPVNHRAFLLASSKLLSFATNVTAEAASPIIAAAFPSVYRELQRESLPDFLSYVFPFVDWDRCKVARRELARSFLNSNWRPRDIALAAARAGDAGRIIRSIAKRDNGSRAINSIEREADSLPDPWKHQVKKAIKDLRNDPP
ncbi:hypothetical protein EOC93_23635 [Mesorhizobium sp. M6A.T.Ce.TU.002.03.1.1]|uniref:GAP1-N1 domain-containing protein n=1 Tax=Mesorhizobium sp. M6A.T.Ce.TU.002.03.1.1 TaxID=2496782 RepID=UPI000FCBF28F|nr:hypothetical protein [Mesorhizobium sp. M6A.T.Ce.TU.002.03.1.1]RUU38048.1 hypothetical protein EOC93_23635 [Mesorhizobium sp. M6A.T.Ce.TU.002.03.1.1]